MPVLRLLAKLLLYYGFIAGSLTLLMWLFPSLQASLPIGRVQALIAQAEEAGGRSIATAAVTSHSGTLGASLLWLTAAVTGALLAALPVSWVYMEIRNPHDYDQSLVDTIVVLPLVVTAIVVVVQHSLALSFSLAGIAGAARYRNSLKSSGDLLFILLSIAIGLATGIGAMELSLVSSAAFNLCFVALWYTNYGERREMKRFLNEFDHHERHHGGVVTETTTVIAEVIEKVERHDDGD